MAWVQSGHGVADAMIRGDQSCFLNSDLANPTSNAIYQRVGYRPACDDLDIAFG